MDDVFDNWIDKTGRTLSLSNLVRDKSGEQAAWHALNDLGYAAISWDEASVRVRVAAGSVDPGTLVGLMETLKAVRRAITLEVWDGTRWVMSEFDSGAGFTAGIEAAIEDAS